MLTALGVEYEAVTPEVVELSEGADPEQLVIANARRKAEAGLRLDRGDLVLGVDTEVVLDGRPLGKASDEDEAREHLLALSGRTHEVLSGVCVVALHQTRPMERNGGEDRDADALPSSEPAESSERRGVARSLVTFAELSAEMVAVYLASGEWRDRAGAYAIQGLGSVLVERLEGDFSNVVGLPLQLLLELVPELFPSISSDSARGAENS